jgi:hypothetical protein
VKVTDDIGGVAICSVDVNVIAHPSKNIQLRAGVQANDIALDHVNADMYVLYNDKSIWKYPRSAWYQSGSQFATLYAPGGQGTSIDMSPDEYTVVTASLFTAPMAEIFDPSGVMATGHQYGGANYPQPDAVAMTAGSNKNDLGVVLGWPAQPPTYPLPTTFLILWPEGNWTGHLWYGYDATVYTGYDVIYYPYIKGAESDNTGNFVWYLEGDPDYYASRWTPDVWPYQHYNNAYFGIGTATDSDDGWYSGLDITHDNLNRFFVLDQLSTSVPRIKMWTVSGDTTTSKGGFADATSISSTPRKIEGCNFNGDVVVLHGTSTYMVSVFVPFEMPL